MAIAHYRHHKNDTMTSYNNDVPPPLSEARSDLRLPGPYDVLSGRGGFVNAHTGNVSFREIVQDRRTEYSLENNKERKMEICREVIALVHSRGGEFLVKDDGKSGANTNLWKIMSDERIVAKTNQALREGAPKIREAFSHDKVGAKRKRRTPPSTNPNRAKRSFRENDETFFVPIESSPELKPSTPDTMVEMSDEEFGIPDSPQSGNSSECSVHLFEMNNYPVKGEEEEEEDDVATIAIDEEVELPYKIHEIVEFEIPRPVKLQRQNSLILSDISPHPNYLEEDFVDPFANESWNHHHIPVAPAPVRRISSDFGGFRSLMENDKKMMWSLQRGVSSTLPTELMI